MRIYKLTVEKEAAVLEEVRKHRFDELYISQVIPRPINRTDI